MPKTMKDVWCEYALGLNKPLAEYLNLMPEGERETAAELMHEIWISGFMQARGMIVKQMSEAKMVEAAKHFGKMGDDEPKILSS